MTKKVGKVPLGDNDFSNETLIEKILKQCHHLYTDSESGLIKIAKRVSLDLVAPRKKITVLLIGNHSAGKSSFINWYVEEHIQKTGVAIETQGVAFVTSGKKRETFTGNATLHLYGHFEPLREINGVVDYLSTEVSTSKEKKFNLVTFIDTPGLVDGGMKYPFDINKAIVWLGNLADLILVFFEPVGQALCKRTLDLVEELSQKNGERMRFYLSKADEAGNEADRQKVLMQIVQEICKRPALNKTSFDMPTIYITNHNAKQTRCLNQIDETCKEIEKAINRTVQNTLNYLECDCQKIASLIDRRLQEDQKVCEKNSAARVRGSLLGAVGVAMPSFLFLCFVSSLLAKESFLPLTGGMVLLLEPFVRPLSELWALVSPSLASCFTTLLFGVLMILVARIYLRSIERTLTKKQKQQLLDDKEYVLDYVKKKKDNLYKEYLNDYVTDHEI